MDYGPFQVHRAFLQQEITLKIMELHPIERSEPLRLFFCEQLQLIVHSPRMLVYVDESHCKPTEFRRKYGRSERGSPAFMLAPHVAHGEGQSVSAVCALGLNGLLSVNVLDGEVTGNRFMEILEDEILPKMLYPQDNSILVLENVSTHNHDAIFAMAEACGVMILFLPPYSYDYKPLEP